MPPASAETPSCAPPPIGGGAQLSAKAPAKKEAFPLIASPPRRETPLLGALAALESKASLKPCEERSLGPYYQMESEPQYGSSS